MDTDRVKYKNGEPCKHPGCMNHVTHPCEMCGRIAAQGEVYEHNLLGRPQLFNITQLEKMMKGTVG